MLQQMDQTEARNLVQSCQAVSPRDEPCDSAATFRVSAGGGSAPSMPRMRPGTPASWSRETKGARLGRLRQAPGAFIITDRE